ncbi:hypothetical protein KEM55_003545 [Ascosphaera atra]|nr:hypothetical protein KEM55_003545 [Ascosphaera atra]
MAQCHERLEAKKAKRAVAATAAGVAVAPPVTPSVARSGDGCSQSPARHPLVPTFPPVEEEIAPHTDSARQSQDLQSFFTAHAERLTGVPESRLAYNGRVGRNGPVTEEMLPASAPAPPPPHKELSRSQLTDITAQLGGEEMVDRKRRRGGGDASPRKKVRKKEEKEKKEEEKDGRVPFNKARFMELKGKVKEWPEALGKAAGKCSTLAEWRESPGGWRTKFSRDWPLYITPAEQVNYDLGFLEDDLFTSMQSWFSTQTTDHISFQDILDEVCHLIGYRLQTTDARHELDQACQRHSETLTVYHACFTTLWIHAQSSEEERSANSAAPYFLISRRNSFVVPSPPLTKFLLQQERSKKDKKESKPNLNGFARTPNRPLLLPSTVILHPGTVLTRPSPFPNLKAPQLKSFPMKTVAPMRNSAPSPPNYPDGADLGSNQSAALLL